jgi:hypothetical protein
LIQDFLLLLCELTQDIGEGYLRDKARHVTAEPPLNGNPSNINFIRIAVIYFLRSHSFIIADLVVIFYRENSELVIPQQDANDLESE